GVESVGRTTGARCGVEFPRVQYSRGVNFPDCARVRDAACIFRVEVRFEPGVTGHEPEPHAGAQASKYADLDYECADRAGARAAHRSGPALLNPVALGSAGLWFRHSADRNVRIEFAKQTLS